MRPPLPPPDELDEPNRNLLVQAVRYAWPVVKRPDTRVLEQAATIIREASLAPKRVLRTDTATRGRSVSGWGLGVAAAMLLFVGGIWTLQHVPGVRDSSSREYATQRAQHATIDLPDGTRVVLGPDTRLWYEESANQARRVRLEGQAYFTVTHEASRTFVVHAGQIEARVLGTAFLVRAYPADSAVRVGVADGRIAMTVPGTDSSTPVTLLPGDIGNLRFGQPLQVTRDARVADIVGWMYGQAVFENAPLRDVVRELERIYDLDIHFADTALARRPVTTALSDASAEEMLELVTLAADVRYVREGRRVRLFAR